MNFIINKIFRTIFYLTSAVFVSFIACNTTKDDNKVVNISASGTSMPPPADMQLDDFIKGIQPYLVRLLKPKRFTESVKTFKKKLLRLFPKSDIKDEEIESLINTEGGTVEKLRKKLKQTKQDFFKKIADIKENLELDIKKNELNTNIEVNIDSPLKIKHRINITNPDASTTDKDFLALLPGEQLDMNLIRSMIVKVIDITHKDYDKLYEIMNTNNNRNDLITLNFPDLIEDTRKQLKIYDFYFKLLNTNIKELDKTLKNPNYLNRIEIKSKDRQILKKIEEIRKLSNKQKMLDKVSLGSMINPRCNCLEAIKYANKIFYECFRVITPSFRNVIFKPAEDIILTVINNSIIKKGKVNKSENNPNTGIFKQEITGEENTSRPFILKDFYSLVIFYLHEFTKTLSTNSLKIAFNEVHDVLLNNYTEQQLDTFLLQQSVQDKDKLMEIYRSKVKLWKELQGVYYKNTKKSIIQDDGNSGLKYYTVFDITNFFLRNYNETDIKLENLHRILDIIQNIIDNLPQIQATDINGDSLTGTTPALAKEMEAGLIKFRATKTEVQNTIDKLKIVNQKIDELGSMSHNILIIQTISDSIKSILSTNPFSPSSISGPETNPFHTEEIDTTKIEQIKKIQETLNDLKEYKILNHFYPNLNKHKAELEKFIKGKEKEIFEKNIKAKFNEIGLYSIQQNSSINDILKVVQSYFNKNIAQELGKKLEYTSKGKGKDSIIDYETFLNKVEENEKKIQNTLPLLTEIKEPDITNLSDNITQTLLQLNEVKTLVQSIIKQSKEKHLPITEKKDIDIDTKYIMASNSKILHEKDNELRETLGITKNKDFRYKDDYTNYLSAKIIKDAITQNQDDESN